MSNTIKQAGNEYPAVEFDEGDYVTLRGHLYRIDAVSYFGATVDLRITNKFGTTSKYPVDSARLLTFAYNLSYA